MIFVYRKGGCCGQNWGIRENSGRRTPERACPVEDCGASGRAPGGVAIRESADLVVPDYAATLKGWRFWKLRQDPKAAGAWITSVVRHDIWMPTEKFEARGMSGQGESDPGGPPEADERHGIYAYKTISSALQETGSFCYRGTLLGRVHLWGVVQEHSFGYRAQYGYPESLHMGVCCICTQTFHLASEPFAIGWAYYHFSDDFSVNGILCDECNRKYYSLDATESVDELSRLAEKYGILIG